MDLKLNLSFYLKHKNLELVSNNIYFILFYMLQIKVFQLIFLVHLVENQDYFPLNLVIVCILHYLFLDICLKQKFLLIYLKIE